MCVCLCGKECVCVLCTMSEGDVLTLTDKFKSTFTIRFLSISCQSKRHKISFVMTNMHYNIIQYTNQFKLRLLYCHQSRVVTTRFQCAFTTCVFEVITLI